MFSWLWRRAGGASGELDRQLRPLEAEAERAPEAVRGQIYNRAGDLCVQAGRRKRALVYYGCAIDAYLRAGYLGPAAAMCRKVLRASPEAMRAHYTLACLAAHGRQLDDVRREIGELVAASRRTGTERLTIPRLRLLADAVTEIDVRRFLAEQLLALGDEVGGERVLRSLETAGPHDGHDVVAGETRWEKLVHAAAVNPDDVWRYA